MSVASIPVAAFFHEPYAILPLGFTALASVGLWALLYLPRRRAGPTQLKHALIIAALGWFVATALGALPLYLTSLRLPAGLASPFADMTNAFFESIAGFTTTGATVVTQPELLPQTLLWWRSFTQWIGGVGIIVFVLTILSTTGASAAKLYDAEGRGEKIQPSARSSLQTIWWIYLLFTVVGVFALWGFGMPVWPAVNHAMCAVATGGFTMSAESIAVYPGIGIQLVLSVLMFCGATSFAVHYRVMQQGVGIYWKDREARGYLLFVLAWILLLFLNNLDVMPVGTSARLSFFQAISAATTTGFQTTDISSWAISAKLILIAAMFVGAMIGSTGGGLKSIRALLLFRATRWHIESVSSPPQRIIPLRIGKLRLLPAEANPLVTSAAVIAFLWMLCLALGVISLVHILPPSTSLVDIIFEVTSAQSTVGLTVGLVGPTMPTLAKLVLSFLMILGRLEIIPVLLLLRGLVLRRA